MATSFRVATFNVENLLSRARLLNFEDNAQADPYLQVVNELRTELAKQQYDAHRILSLYESVREYIDIVEVRGKLFNRQKTALVANGVADWGGFIEFKREKFSDAARENTARVIRDVNPDILCLIEVESRPVLRHFCTDRLPRTNKFGRYDFHMVIDGNDNRGIDVGLATRVPINGLWSHVHDRVGKTLIFSRDCLEVQLVHPSGIELRLLINHFKSKGYGAQPTSNATRRRQAERVAQILDERYDLQKQNVIVAGDFNDTPDSAALAPLLAVPDLFDVLGQKFSDAADRWTYHYRKNQQIDYLLVSRPLRDALRDAGIERRGIFGVDEFSKGAIHAYDDLKREKDSASDHGAVWADFSM